MTAVEDLLTARELRRAVLLAHRDPRHVQRAQARLRLRRLLALLIASRRGAP